MKNPADLLQIAEFLNARADGKPVAAPATAKALLARVGNVATMASVMVAVGLAGLVGPQSQARAGDFGRPGGAVGQQFGHGRSGGNEAGAFILGALLGAVVESQAVHAPNRDGVLGAAVGGGVGLAVAGNRASTGEKVLGAVVGGVIGGAIGSDFDRQRNAGQAIIAAPQPPPQTVFYQPAPVMPPPPVFVPAPPPVVYQPAPVVYGPPPPPPNYGMSQGYYGQPQFSSPGNTIIVIRDSHGQRDWSHKEHDLRRARQSGVEVKVVLGGNGICR